MDKIGTNGTKMPPDTLHCLSFQYYNLTLTLTPLDSCLQSLSARCDRSGAWRLASHLATLAITGVALTWARGTAWVVPALLAHGAVLVFLFAPLHETIHRTAFKSRIVNDAVARFCGVLLLLPPAYFRYFHLRHHRDTQRAGHDPELISPKPSTPAAYFIHLSGLPYWRERVVTLLRHSFGRIDEAFIPRNHQPRVVREARYYVTVYLVIAGASLLLESDAIVTYWVLPILIGQPLLRAFLLAEHTDCPLVPNMLENSRTTTSNPVVRWLSWNMPFHTAHHAYPGVPFHRLAILDRELGDDVRVRARSYLATHREIFNRLRLNPTMRREL